MVTQRFWKPLLLISCGLGVSIAALKAVSKDSQPSMTHSSPQTPPASVVSTQVLSEDKTIPRYDHIFVIIAENKNYDQIIGSASAPHLTQLAKTYGLATQFYGEVHPSEANYVAMLGGSTFGIHDDDAYYCDAASLKPFCGNRSAAGYANHTIAQSSLVDQLQQHHLTWKGYFEDLPEPGSTAVIAPSKMRPLYASKHNGFMNFKHVQDDPDRAQKIVALPQLTTDLKSSKVPNYSHIILNQCQEMHGLSECPNTPNLIRTGDTRIAQIVQQIMSSSTWSAPSNSAIVITWDEDSGKTSGQQGCCGYDPNSAANFGGGHIATLVITNHGRQHVTDSTPYNHYSLLRTTEDAFGIYEYLNQAGDTAHGVKPMTALFGKPSR